MITEQSGCDEYLYGVTPDIATLIYQTCQLAEHLGRFRDIGEIVPDDFLEMCEQVGNRLQAWRFDSDEISSIPRDDRLRSAILTHQSKAWHSAALIYYYTRIQGCSPEQLVQEVEDVAEHMHASEDVKLAFETAYDEPNMAHLRPAEWYTAVAPSALILQRMNSSE